MVGMLELGSCRVFFPVLPQSRPQASPVNAQLSPPCSSFGALAQVRAPEQINTHSCDAGILGRSILAGEGELKVGSAPETRMGSVLCSSAGQAEFGMNFGLSSFKSQWDPG